jgi:membrane protein YqaA with SNARE-associated domain
VNQDGEEEANGAARSLHPCGRLCRHFPLQPGRGVVPIFNVEIYLLSLSTLSPDRAALPVALSASLGQMAAKSLLYLAGRGVVRLPFGKAQSRVQAEATRLARAQAGPMSVVMASALTGLPPFYAVSVAAGMLKLRFVRFFLFGCAGRFLRFALVLGVPALFQ